MEDYANLITERIIGCVINVDKQLGPGLLGSIYEKAICIDVNQSNIVFESQKQLPVFYMGKVIEIFLK